MFKNYVTTRGGGVQRFCNISLRKFLGGGGILCDHSPLSFFKACNFSTSSFADDSNGSKEFALSFQFHVLHNEIPKCMESLIRWSNLHSMKINPNKTEIILLRPQPLHSQVKINWVFIEDQCIRVSDKVKNVEVWLGKYLNFNKRVNAIVSYRYKRKEERKKEERKKISLAQYPYQICKTFCWLEWIWLYQKDVTQKSFGQGT